MRPGSSLESELPPAAGEPVHAPSRVRGRIVSFERSAALALSLLVAGSFALQTLVIAHGHVAGHVSGQAEAALVGEKPSQVAEEAVRAPTGAMLRLGSALRDVDIPAASESADRTVAPAHGMAVAAAVPGLRTSTFGPELGKSPRIRTAMLGPASLGNAPSPSAPPSMSDAHQEVIVIRPGSPRTLQLQGSRSDAERSPPKPAARVLGKATEQDVSGLVERVHFQPHTPERCLPHDLLDVVYDIAEKFGEVQILSTFRDPERNRRVGGAEQSFHLSCQAIDFRVTGNAKGLLSYLEARPEVGGLKRYPMGYYHIDNGPRRSW